MVINYSKIKEIVFYWPHPTKFSTLPSFTDVELTHDAKLLGIVLSDNLSFKKHGTVILTCCSHRFYLMKLLGDGGMSVNNFDVVFSSHIFNRIAYCMPAF